MAEKKQETKRIIEGANGMRVEILLFFIPKRQQEVGGVLS